MPSDPATKSIRPGCDVGGLPARRRTQPSPQPGGSILPAGYQVGSDRQPLRNQCYCHGDRHDPPRPPLTEQTARDAFIDYAYVLEANRLRVLTNRPGGWQPVAEAAWTERPDWVIDQHAQHLRRGW